MIMKESIYCCIFVSYCKYACVIFFIKISQSWACFIFPINMSEKLVYSMTEKFIHYFFLSLIEKLHHVFMAL